MTVSSTPGLHLVLTQTGKKKFKHVTTTHTDNFTLLWKQNNLFGNSWQTGCYLPFETTLSIIPVLHSDLSVYCFWYVSIQDLCPLRAAFVGWLSHIWCPKAVPVQKTLSNAADECRWLICGPAYPLHCLLHFSSERMKWQWAGQDATTNQWHVG